MVICSVLTVFGSIKPACGVVVGTTLEAQYVYDGVNPFVSDLSSQSGVPPLPAAQVSYTSPGGSSVSSEARMPSATTFGAGTTISMSGNDGDFASSAVSRSTSIYRAIHPTSATFAASIPLYFDGDLTGMFAPDPGETGGVTGAMSATVRLSTRVYTPSFDGQLTGTLLANYFGEETMRWNAATQSFELDGTLSNKGYYYSGLPEDVVFPGPANVPDTVFLLTSSGGGAISDGLRIVLDGSVPFTAISGDDYVVEFEVDVFASAFGGTALPGTTRTVNADFLNTGTFGFVPDGGSGGSFTLVTIPEPSTLAALALTSIALCGRRRLRINGDH